MVDDLGAIDDRMLDNLPNIKSLWLDNGLRFDNYYNETPLCCPGRASFLTGQHTSRHGVTTNSASKLNPANTVVTALHDAGYRTGLFGKYLNNLGSIDKTPPGYDYVVMQADNSSNPSNWYVQGQLTTGGYMDRYATDKAVAWLTNVADKQPVFLWANHKAPHLGPTQSKPWQPWVESRYTGAGGSRCNNIPKWKPPDYSYSPQPTGWPLGATCRSLLTTDDMVRQLRIAQEARGRPTVWVFTSDHGMAWGRKGFPLKNVPWASRTPLYFAGTGITTGVSLNLVSNIDLGPTLAAIGGTTMPHADGTSFAGLLSGGAGGREWMLEDEPVSNPTHGPWRGAWWGIRTPRWHLLAIKDRPYELYDLKADRWEQVNVASTNPSVVKELKNKAVGLISAARMAR